MHAYVDGYNIGMLVVVVGTWGARIRCLWCLVYGMYVRVRVVCGVYVRACACGVWCTVCTGVCVSKDDGL